MAMIVDGPYVDTQKFTVEKTVHGCNNIADKICIEIVAGSFFSLAYPTCRCQ